MSIDNIGDMKGCGHAEYRRIYDKHKENLTVFSSYSGGILGMPQMSTAWGIRGMETALIASECEDWEHRREDPDAWTYWENADLVAALDRAESAESELAALRQWAEEAESRALEYAKKADAAIARAEATGQALTALHAAQNGPPLLRDAPEWNAAMKMTEAVLGLNPADAVLSSTPTPQLKVRIA